MAGYTKLFGSIVHSTIWRESPETKVLWVTMLALADQNGEVMASVPGLADVARITLEQCEASLAKFQAPDPYSRTPDNEGRRIQAIPGGWAILNHGIYRTMQSEAHRREMDAARQRRFREGKKAAALPPDAPPCHASSHDSVTAVTSGNPIAEAEAEAEAETEKRSKDEAKPSAPLPASSGKLPSYRDIFPDRHSLEWFDKSVELRAQHIAGMSAALKEKRGVAAHRPLPAAKKFLDRVATGYDPRLLSACLWCYLEGSEDVQRGFVQSLETFWGDPASTKPGVKATFQGYVNAGRALLASRDAARTAPKGPAPAPTTLPVVPASLLGEVGALPPPVRQPGQS